MPRSTQQGFTLIELLCVMAIILILVSLSLGPVTRALKRAINFGWEYDSIQLADQFRDRMSKNFGTVPNYPALTIDQLFEAGLINDRLRTFLRDKRVHFFPFSSETPDGMPILQVKVSRSRDYFVRKRDLKPEE